MSATSTTPRREKQPTRQWSRFLVVVLVVVEAVSPTAWIPWNLLRHDDLPRQRLSCFVVVDAIFVGGILLPHGDFALDPTLFEVGTLERNISYEIARQARRAGQWLLSTEERRRRRRQSLPPPDIVFQTTPHGIKLDYDYGIYLSKKGQGTATIGNDLPPSPSSSPLLSLDDYRHRHHYNVSLEVVLAPMDLGQDLLECLTERPSNTKHHEDVGFPVSGIYSYNDDTPFPLNWGEIIPLLLMQQSYPRSHDAGSGPLLQPTKRHLHSPSSLLLPKPLIWTFPHRRYDHGPEMVPELLDMGAKIMEWIERRPERIGVVISGDLSHTHQASGPYGYSNASAPFDTALGRWAKGGNRNNTHHDREDYGDPCDPNTAKSLLETARTLQPNAMSCGFTGYVLWHGMMRCPERNHENTMKIPQYRSKVFVNKNVTYYGMMAAVFEPTSPIYKPI